MECIFYDEEGKKVFYDISKPFNKGEYGKIYRVDSQKCLKLFDSIERLNISDKDSFIDLMNIDSDNFYKIYKLLYTDVGFMKGYLMKYYENVVQDILSMPMEYMLDNFNRLYDVMKRITKKRILMNDIHGKNFVLTKNDIVITDCDSYYHDSDMHLMSENRGRLYRAFSEILSLSLSDNYKDKICYADRVKYYKCIRQLFDFDDNPSNITSKVRSYKKPIDYLHSQVGR